MIKDRLFRIMLENYGYQGWWPITSMAGEEGFNSLGYHPGDYTPPHNKAERFEIIVGALLTQNTSWINVEKAIEHMRMEAIITPEDILKTPPDKLAFVVKSSGYYNEKAKKLKRISGFFADDVKLEKESAFSGIVTREILLSLWGIGKETADSILLYAYHYPVFVVDTYTKRILSRLGIIRGSESYDEIQMLFSSEELNAEKHKFFNEYHALFVQHAKRYCRKKPVCSGCPLADMCIMRKTGKNIIIGDYR